MKKNSFFRIFLGFLFLIAIGTKSGYSQIYESFMSFYSEVRTSCEIPTDVDTNDLTNEDKEQIAEINEEGYLCRENIYEDGWHPYNRMLFDSDSETVMQILQTESDSMYEHNGFIVAVMYDKIFDGYYEQAYNLDSLIYEQRVYGENDVGDYILYAILRINYVKTIDGYIVPEKMMYVWWDTLPSGIPYKGKYICFYLYYELLDEDGNSLTKTGDENLFNECMKENGIKEVQQQANVSIFPNPAKTHFTVTNTEHASLYLYNVLGQEVFSTQSTEENTIINVNSLPQGLYVLKVVKDGVASTHKVVVRD